MIFVTVGTQLPFDRLLRAVDAWAAAPGRPQVFAQTGPTTWRPEWIEHTPFVAAEDFRRHVAEAELVVGHAGMGSIITALELGKPIVVMPRRADLGEHRNDHQMATARRFEAQGRIHVAWNEEELTVVLNRMDTLTGQGRIGSEAAPTLIAALRDFIAGRPVRELGAAHPGGGGGGRATPD